jgi:hypothetical protein
MSVALDKIRDDPLALSVARALFVANEAACAQGIDPSTTLVTVSEASPPPERTWRIHYGPRDYVLRRGGDFMVVVDGLSGEVKRTLRGQ